MKILYHIPTGTLKKHNRDDDEPVVGLDPEYNVFDVVQEPAPDINPSTHALQPTETIDVEAKTVTRGYQAVDYTPPPVIVTKRSLLLKMTPTQRQALAAGIASMPEGQDKSNALIYYNNSTTVSRAHPMASFFATLIGLDAAGMDALFAAAKEQDIAEATHL